MARILKNKNGYSTVLLALLLPALICVLGFALDGGLLIYRANELSSAVKIAAISATSICEVDDEYRYTLTGTSTDVQDLLSTNMRGATLNCFMIDDSVSGKCTVEGSFYVEFVFMKIFGIEGKIVTSRFTARRSGD